MHIEPPTTGKKIFVGTVIIGALASSIVAEQRAFERYPCPAREVESFPEQPIREPATPVMQSSGEEDALHDFEKVKSHPIQRQKRGAKHVSQAAQASVNDEHLVSKR